MTRHRRKHDWKWLRETNRAFRRFTPLAYAQGRYYEKELKEPWAVDLRKRRQLRGRYLCPILFKRLDAEEEENWGR